MIATTRAGLRRMRALDPRSPHRVASPLELLFDLVFVVAVSQASSTLHHLISEGEAAHGLLSYAMVFFAVWWAWMNFTWFASAFDTDDWLYRVMTIAQMGGVLVLAAGVQQAMLHDDFLIVTIGYVIMRLSMVAQWLRAAISDAASRPTALRFAIGVAGVQVLWVARLALPEGAPQLIGFFVLMIVEIAVPVWAERHGRTQWHPHHIAERYGLFTLILLGESLLASANAMIDALSTGEHTAQLIGLAASGVVITASIWWIYFAREQAARLRSTSDGFVFGYLHYFLFAAVGAVSSGVEVEIDHVTGATEISGSAAGLALTLPLALFLLATWVVLLRGTVRRTIWWVILVGIALVAASGLLPVGEFIAAAAVMIGVVTLLEVDASRTARSTTRHRD